MLAAAGARHLDAVIAEPTRASALSSWRGLGVLRSSVGAQGVSPAPGALLPQALPLPLSGRATTVSMKALAGTTTIDALILRPSVSRVTLSGAGSASTELAQSTSLLPQRTTVGAAGSTVRVYDDRGRLVRTLTSGVSRAIVLPAGGFAVATR